jgi:putative oxidoreductase
MDIIIKNIGWISKYLYAAIMALFGVQHFMYPNFVARMMPGWIPFHHFWVYFTGSGFIAAAASIWLNWNVKWGCFLLGTMIFIFILTIHIPNLIDDHFSAGDLASASSDLGLGCCAFVLSGTIRS